jgi:hypothetical protein
MPSLRRWEKQIHAQGIDVYSLRLIPLLARKLADAKLNHPGCPRFEGIYQLSRLRNARLREMFRGIVELFRTAGIETLALKGVVLGQIYYRDPAVRYMEDVDILVPFSKVRAAVEVLYQSGWKNKWPDLFSDLNLSLRHAAEFKNAESEKFDLHWHLLPEASAPDHDLPFWTDAFSSEIAGAETLRLSPTDQLFHILAHSLQYSRVPRIAWVMDTATVLQASEIDWQRLAELATVFEVTWRVRTALVYLKERFALPIPADSIEMLEARPVSRRERWTHSARTGGQPRGIDVLSLFWSRYLAMTAAARLRKSPPLRFLPYCAAYWKMLGLSPGQITSQALGLLSRRRKVQSAAERNLEALLNSSGNPSAPGEEPGA